MDELQEEEICARIKKARKEAGFSQEEFAELLEVITRTVQNYESDRVPWTRMGKISEITGKSTRWLLHGEEAERAETDLQDIKAKLELLLSRSTAPETQEEAEETFQQELEAADELAEQPEPGTGRADDESARKDPPPPGPSR